MWRTFRERVKLGRDSSISHQDTPEFSVFQPESVELAGFLTRTRRNLQFSAVICRNNSISHQDTPGFSFFKPESVEIARFLTRTRRNLQFFS